MYVFTIERSPIPLQKTSPYLKTVSEAVVRRCSSKKVFLEILRMLQERPVLESFFNKAAALKTCSFIKKRLQPRWFPVKLETFLRTPFLQNNSGRCFWRLCLFLAEVVIRRGVFTTQPNIYYEVFLWEQLTSKRR